MNYKGAKRSSAAIDWAGMYQDFLASGLSMRKYYAESFVDFCHRCGIYDHILSRPTVIAHLKNERARLLAEEQMAAELQEIVSPDDNGSSVSQSNDDEAKETCSGSATQAEPESQAPSAPDPVRVCDLGEILSDTKPSTVAPQIPAPVTSVAPPTAMIQFIPPRCLITEFKGMKFTFACHDPAKALASLLSQLENTTEARHAH